MGDKAIWRVQSLFLRGRQNQADLFFAAEKFVVWT